MFARRVTPADHLARQRSPICSSTRFPTTRTRPQRCAVGGIAGAHGPGWTLRGPRGGEPALAHGVPELITHSLEDYEALALKLARDPAALTAIRDKIARHRDTHALFDTVRFTRNLEAAYRTMWERYQRVERPQTFSVPASR